MTPDTSSEWTRSLLAELDGLIAVARQRAEVANDFSSAVTLESLEAARRRLRAELEAASFTDGSVAAASDYPRPHAASALSGTPAGVPDSP